MTGAFEHPPKKTKKLLLHYESSTLILYKELSSPIFQIKVCEWVRHLWHRSRSPICSIYKGIYKCPLLTLDYYYNYYRVTWWLDRIFCGRTRSHLAKFYESLHLLTDWEFVLGIQIIATTATEGNMPGKSKKNYVTCVPQILNVFTLKVACG